MAFDDGVKTVSGSVAHTDDAATKVPFVSLKCGIAPTLTGKSAIECTQTGKNLYVADLTQDGANRVILYDNIYLPVGKYYISLTKSGNVANFYMKKHSGGLWSNVGGYNKTEVSVTISEADYYGFSYYISTGVTASDISNVQLEVGMVKTDYETPTAPTTHTASLGRTIYGGTADIVKGEGKDTTLRYELDENDSWSAYSGASHSFWHNVATGEDRPIKQTEASESICNYATYSRASPSSAPDFSFLIQGGQRIVVTADSSIDTVDKFKTWLSSHNLVFVCPASTPTDFTFTPITPTPETVGKVNNVYCDTGNTEVTYYDNAHGFSEVTVNKTGKNLISVPIFTPSTPTLCFDAGRDITVSNITMSFLATNAVVHATNAAIVDYRKEDGTHTYRTLNWFRDANNNQFTANTPQNGKFKNSDSSITFRYIYIYYESITCSQFESDCISEWQIELASTASDYTPYEAVSKTAYLHKVIYGGQADVVRGIAEPKNPLKLYLARTSHQGINFSLTDEGLLHMEGTNTSDTSSAFSGGNYSTYDACPWKFPPGTYTASSLITADTSKVGSVNFLIRTKTNNVNYSYALKDAPKTFTINDDFGAWFWASVLKTETVNCDVGVQLEKGSTASDFAPYFEPFSFPPISISTDEGENTLFANEGDSAITYRRAVD